MKALFILCLFLSINLSAQNSTQKAYVAAPAVTNLQRYKIDYEIKGWTTIQDTVKVNSLDLNYYDSIRLDTADKEIFVPSTAITIIIYSKTKATLNKQ